MDEAGPDGNSGAGPGGSTRCLFWGWPRSRSVPAGRASLILRIGSQKVCIHQHGGGATMASPASRRVGAGPGGDTGSRTWRENQEPSPDGKLGSLILTASSGADLAANQEPLQWQETGGLNQGYVHSTSCRDSLETSALFCRNKAHGILRHYWLHLFFIHLYRDLSSPLPLA